MDPTDEHYTGHIIFEGLVSAKSGKPFVRMTHSDGEQEIVSQFECDVVTAMGLRAIQAAIEAERDAGLVAWVMQEFGNQLELPEDDRPGLANIVLDGMRRFRDQFDPAAGSMRPISLGDTSQFTDAPEDPNAE